MHTLRHRVLTIAALLAVPFAFQANSALAAESGSAMLGEWGIETRYLSPEVSPGDDFFTYLN